MPPVSSSSIQSPQAAEGAFAEYLKNTIAHHGPMSVETFMGMAIEHYYATRDPFGTKGDFTTAPEISQMFGEMIAVFLADAWLKMGSPSPFALVEAGPGRGTLMADILRAAKSVPGFVEGAEIHLVENSPSLRERQAETLSAYQVEWHDDMAGVPDDVPLLFVANELLDALPTRQYQFSGGAWHERLVGLSEDDTLIFGLANERVDIEMRAREGEVIEISPAREDFVNYLAHRLQYSGGVALLIDYGHDHSACGETLQAVRAHEFTNVFESVGDADLTSHVDFDPLVKIAKKAVSVYGPIGQGLFLENLGIKVRARALAGKSPTVHDDLHRLISPHEMGKLFRVIALCDDEGIVLSGF